MQFILALHTFLFFRLFPLVLSSCPFSLSSLCHILFLECGELFRGSLLSLTCNLLQAAIVRMVCIA